MGGKPLRPGLIKRRIIMEYTKKNVAGMIDHTLLKADATEAQIAKLCQEAKEYGFASVCVNPGYVPEAAEALKGTDVRVCTVIGFPLGATSSEAKAAETADAIAKGAAEVDMVVNVGRIKSGNWDYVRSDIAAVVNAARGRALTKVIIETCLLTDDEKIRVCEIAKDAGADFVKTSTGFSTGGATAASKLPAAFTARRKPSPSLKPARRGSVQVRASPSSAASKNNEGTVVTTGAAGISVHT